MQGSPARSSSRRRIQECTHHSSGNRAKRLSINPSARRFSSLARAHSTKRTRGWQRRARRASTKGRSLRLRPTSNAGWTRPGRRLRLRPRRSRMQFRQRILRRLLLRPRYLPPAPATPPVNTVATKKPAASPRAPLVVPAPKAAPDYGQPTSAPTDLRDGLLAFFSNDYRRAVPLLENAARQSGASPRARAFLSCARVALVLTGGAGPQMLRQAREEFLAADLGSAMTAGDRRYVSPRVLEQLERR